MLISRNIRQKLTVLAVGTGLFAGCSSGPQLSSVRFWPGAGKMESAADDEAVAQKWRDRLNASALSNGSGAAPGFETAQAEAEATKPRNSRFNLFRRFSRDEEVEAPQSEKTAEVNPNRDLQRQLLERRIAELEAEQRNLQQKQATGSTSRPGAVDPRQQTQVTDPFLAASQQKQIVRPTIRPAPQGSAAEQGLPSWAQAEEGQKPVISPTREVAGSPKTNAFTPGFEQTMNNLAASADPATAATPQGTAASMPSETQPTITPQKITATARPAEPNPFAAAEQKAAAATPAVAGTAPRIPESTQPRLDRPVADPGQRNQLSALRSAEEQQKVWAQLEVQNLLKHSRILARQGQLTEALTTALAAEQLANSVDIDFPDGVQNPAQLVSSIRLKAKQSPELVARNKPEPKQQVAPRANLNRQPETPSQFVSQNVTTKNVTTKTVTPPQWLGRNTALQPQQVSTNHPLVSTPGVPARNLQTAEFIHSRPAQSVEPHATTSDQWYSTEDQPMNQPRQRSGGYMEAATAPRRSRNEINAQFVSSTTIYSPENLQWSKLEVAQATIHEGSHIPAPPAPVEQSHQHDELPPFAVSHQTSAGEDPFADVFGQDDVSDTLLASDDPLEKFAPTIPTVGAAAATTQERHILGIPIRKLGLVFLAGLILMAAIIHRRRTSELHEL